MVYGSARFFAGVVGQFLHQDERIPYFLHGAFSALCGPPVIIPQLNRRSDAMLPIEEAIIEKLRSGPCCFDEVVTGLSHFSWADVFVAVDCMSRDGRVLLRQLGYLAYELTLKHVA